MREMPHQCGGLVQDRALPVPSLRPAPLLRDTPLRHDCGGLHSSVVPSVVPRMRPGSPRQVFQEKLSFLKKTSSLPRALPLGRGFPGTPANPKPDSSVQEPTPGPGVLWAAPQDFGSSSQDAPSQAGVGVLRSFRAGSDRSGRWPSLRNMRVQGGLRPRRAAFLERKRPFGIPGSNCPADPRSPRSCLTIPQRGTPGVDHRDFVAARRVPDPGLRTHRNPGTGTVAPAKGKPADSVDQEHRPFFSERHADPLRRSGGGPQCPVRDPAGSGARSGTGVR